MTSEEAASAPPIPGARLLLDQLVRLNDHQVSSIDELRQESRAYLGVGALALTAAAALLAISDVHAGLAARAGLALLLFVASAVCAVTAERSASSAFAPNIETFQELVEDGTSRWSDDQLALWAAREFAGSVLPYTETVVAKIARLVNRQLSLFLLEVTVLGGTLVAAVLT